VPSTDPSVARTPMGAVAERRQSPNAHRPMLTYRVGEAYTYASWASVPSHRKRSAQDEKSFQARQCIGSCPTRVFTFGQFQTGPQEAWRKRGTPNAFSPDYKEAILEAAYRVGQDGNGKGGALGYVLWLGKRHPGIFYTVLWISLLELEEAEGNAPEEPRWTTDEINERIRERIRLKGKQRTRRSRSPRDWTGQGPPVGGLMQLAVAYPKAFCELIVAALLRPPTKRQRGRAARRAWEERQRARANDDASLH
jgi:hypothetical protein